MNQITTYCIVLPESPLRTEGAKKHFKEIGLHDVVFFNGIHAETFGLKTVFPYEVDNPGSGFNMGFKPTGIWLSHYMLWSALSLLHDDYYFILECDAKFSTDWNSRLVQALSSTPKDFDILYVGSCCCNGHPQKHVAGEVFEVKYPMCNHAYIVAKKALPVLLSTQRKVYAPIDISMIFHSLPLLKVFTILPRIADQFDTNIPI